MPPTEIEVDPEENSGCCIELALELECGVFVSRWVGIFYRTTAPV